MTSIGKKLLGTLFTVEEGENTKPKEKESQKETFVPKGWENQFQIVRDTVNLNPVTANTGKYKDHFIEVMKEKNIAGPDYFELNELMDKMVNQLPDEKTRMIAAYASLTAQGLTKEKVKDSLQVYNKALEEDAYNFNKNAETLLKNEVDSRKQKIESNSKTIQDLQNKLEQLGGENAKLAEEIETETRNINENLSMYNMELQAKKEKLNGDLLKFEQTITF